MSSKYCLTFILLNVLLFVSADESIQDKQVVIVGAGAAGIAAAQTLLLNNFKHVQILEAQDYYGGRIRTVVDDDNQVLDLGAEALEGNEGNSAYDVLKSAQLIPEPIMPSSVFPNKNREHSDEIDSKIFVKSNGDDIPTEDIKQFQELLDNTLNELHNSTNLVSDFYHQKFQEAYSDSEKLGIGLSYAQIFAESYTPSSDWKQTNGIGHGQQRKLKGGGFRHPNGMKIVLDTLMGTKDGKLSETWQKVLKLNSKVTHIDWSSNTLVVSYTDLVTNEKHEIIADFVIVTVPLGVLKHDHEKMFSPALPQKITQAINTLNFGLENKIFLKFSEKWWPEGKTLHVIWRPEDKKKLSEEDQWLPKIEVIAPKNDNTLMVYVMESENYHSDNLSEKELTDKLMAYIRKAFHNKGWNIVDPIKVTHSKWFANPYIRGALSYPTVASFEKGVKNSDLATILFHSNNRPVVFFAGEATSDAFYGSVHGAVDSGMEAARKLMLSS